MSDLTMGRDRLGDLEVSSRREWLVTNGIGGYASGTVSGALGRRYHGLLIAALKPPLERVLLLTKVSETIELDGSRIELDTNRWASGSIQPYGHVHLESFRLEDTVPTWTWAIGDTRLEKRVWMEQGENTTYIQYRAASARGPVRLRLRVFANHRDSHELTGHGEWLPRVDPATSGLRVQMHDGATPLWLLAPGAEIKPLSIWHRSFALPLEADRGLDWVEDHVQVAEITTEIAPGDTFTVVGSTRRDVGLGSRIGMASALARRRAHERSLIDAWKRAYPGAEKHSPAWVRALVLAADAFIVERATSADPNGRTVIAGYPWFSDWGRDLMIALPGLTLATGRPEVARSILTTIASHVDRGMVPNYFPERSETPEYNTVDASLWFFQAVRAYYEATRDDKFLAEMCPVLEDIGAWYERGTRHGIVVDPEDGLVRAGEDGFALTWMDARADGWVVTPRIGKPVEVNALWYNALTSMASFTKRLKRPHETYQTQATAVGQHFGRYWNAETGCLYDVLDGPRGDDPSIRPNQLFAVSLPESPLTAGQRRAVLEACGRWLLTSHGMRTLPASDPRYHGAYTGDRKMRDGAYHQGTVWTWLLPHYVLAHERVHEDAKTALSFLDPMASLLEAYGIGSLPEITDGDLPYSPCGCFAQAWSVAEVLRVYQQIAFSKRRPRRRSAKKTEAALT